MTIGIYSLTNTVNGKRYIGKSIDIERRTANHRRSLTKINPDGRNVNTHLYNSVVKYGWDSFNIEILQSFDIVDEDKISDAELFWIAYYSTTDPSHGYNRRLDSATKMVVHESTKELCRVNATGESNPNYGNHWSTEQKSAMSSVKKNQHESGIYGDDWKRKIGVKSKAFWKNNPDVKQQMANNVSKSKMKYDFHQLDDDGSLIKVWGSVAEIIEHNPTWKWQQIYSVCNGHKKRIYGFKWKKVLKDED